MINCNDIAKRYQSAEYLQYPKMEQLLTDLIKDPQKKIEIPSDLFATKREPPKWFLPRVIQKVSDIFKAFIVRLRCRLSSRYKASHTNAVKNITASYEIKLKEISRLANQSINCIDRIKEKEKLIEKLKEEVKKQDPAANKSHVESLEKTIKEAENEVKLAKTESKQLTKKIKTHTNDKGFIPKHVDNKPKPPENIPRSPSQPSPTTKVEQKKESQKADSEYSRMISNIRAKTYSEKVTELWTLLMGNFKNIEQDVVSWNCGENGEFVLKLRNTLRVWFPSKKTIKGAVFLLGDNGTRSISGKLLNSHIQIADGFGSCCRCKYLFATITARPKMNGVDCSKAADKVNMSGTFLGVTQNTEHSFDDLKKDWQNNGKVVGDDYENSI